MSIGRMPTFHVSLDSRGIPGVSLDVIARRAKYVIFGGELDCVSFCIEMVQHL